MSRGGFSLRRQLPVHSPLPASALAQALPRLLRREEPHRRLRRLLAERFQADDAVLFGSGTQALTAAIRLGRTRAGSDTLVALPAYTCYDIGTAAVGADARVVLYDVDPATLAPDWASVESALRAGARVVVLGPLHGFPFDWSVATELADRYGAVLIEDAAQAAGGEWNGRAIGTFGDLTVLSFGRGKGWTGGGGGALLVRSGTEGAGTGDEMIQADAAADAPPAPEPSPPAAELATAAAVIAQWIMARPAIYGIPYALPMLHLGETVYHPPQPEQAITRAAAAVALATEGPSRAAVEGRRRSADHIRSLLTDAGVPLRPITVPPESAPGYLRFPCLGPPEPFDDRTLRLLGRHGVETGYPTTLAELPAVSARLAATGPVRFPGAETLARRLVSLPTHALAGERDWSAIVGVLRNAGVAG